MIGEAIRTLAIDYPSAVHYFRGMPVSRENCDATRGHAINARTLVAGFFQLTKPSVMVLVLAAGATSLLVEGSLLTEPFKIAAFLTGLFLTGGCANALNQYLERHTDSRMSRTSHRRPLPKGLLSPAQALLFSVVIGVIGILTLGMVFNLLTAALALATILFYVLAYTLWLKPVTAQNIVIGGIAGAMAPVGAWAAATGSTALMPWYLFLIIFAWTPPHFWSLALRYKEDYLKAGLPMMPIVKGNQATLSRVFLYTLALFVVSFLPLTVRFGWCYLCAAVVLGLIYVGKAYRVKRKPQNGRPWELFRYSILYLFGLLSALVLDSFL